MPTSMRSSCLSWTVAWAACMAACAPVRGIGQTTNITPREILDKVDDLYRGESARGELTMHIATRHWKRSLSVEFQTQGRDRSLFRVLSPEKERDTATLRVGNEIWNYLPKVNRVIKLPSSMMSASWMGSHFTNDDLVKDSRFTEEYHFEISFEGRRDNRDVIEITCLPRPDAAVVWGKVIVLVGKEGYLPLSLAYYDEDMALARTMTFEALRKVGERTVPTQLTVVPEAKPGEKTVVIYDRLAFDVEMPDAVFSLRSLRR